MVERVSIVYFSGTGSTAKAAECFKTAFGRRRINVSCHEIFRSALRPDGKTGADMLVALFPVHALNAPLPVYEWLDGAAHVDNIPAAVISVSGGGEMTPNRACRLATIKCLQKKGYNVIHDSMLVMPSNILIRTADSLSARLLEALPLRVERLVDELLAGEKRRGRPDFLNRLLSRFGELEKVGAPWVGAAIKANAGCTGCGWCETNCPCGNIAMKAGRPEFRKSCVLCMRCMYGCPRKALRPGIFKSFFLKDGFDLKVMESVTAASENEVKRLAPGVLWKGLREYLQGKR